MRKLATLYSAAVPSKENYLTLVLCSLVLLFAISLFKNISYPLLWADESMTVMGGVRVMEFGYPKVHDGKNVFYDLKHPDMSLGIDEKTDAYVGGAGWGQYYFSVPGIKLAELTDDFFVKTAIIRATFALVGLAGLVILALLGMLFFRTELSRTGYLALFVFLELISVSLVLHLREVRYYSLTIFLMASCIAVYTRYRILKIGRYQTCAALLAVLLPTVFITFSPVYFILLVSICLFESILLAKNLVLEHRSKENKADTATFSLKAMAKDSFLALLPMLISMMAVLPLASFFRTFHIAREMAAYNEQFFGVSRLDMYSDNLNTIWGYFSRFDLIYLALVLKLILAVCFVLRRENREERSLDPTKLAFSFFLTVLFIVYSLAIARIPNFLFTRYFIPLQPVLALIIILDAAVIFNFLSRLRSAKASYSRRALIIIFAGLVLLNITANFKDIEGHAYELIYQYKGPLDYIIPFIKDKYNNTDKLVIATNYEETSLMYYLNSKVIMGYVGNNLEEDSKALPDIIVYREGWDAFIETFIRFKMSHPYTPVFFPVVKSQINNIPELNLTPPLRHLFRTEVTDNDEDKVDILLSR